MKNLLTIGGAIGLSLLGWSVTAHAATLDEVKGRNVLRCGVAPNSPGFSARDKQGNVSGFDIDFCHAIAAAVLGDAKRIETQPLGLRDGFTTLTTGGIDILTHRFTWTFNRDNGTGLQFAMPYFYDGQGFIVRKDSGVTSISQMGGATICVAQGSTTELNIADYFSSHGMEYQIATFADLDEARNAYEEGRCDAWSNDRASLAARSLAFKNRDEHLLLPETISKEPIGPITRMNDPAWSRLITWVIAVTVAAEELKITSKNVDEIKASSANPEVKRLLGVGENLGEKIGLKEDWAYQVIKQVGNYGEIFERNIGKDTPLALDRGVNNLWTAGGVLMAPPFR